MDRLKTVLAIICGVHTCISIPILALAIDRGRNISEDLAVRTSFLEEVELAVGILVLSVLSNIFVHLIMRTDTPQLREKLGANASGFVSSWHRRCFRYDRFNIVDLFYITIVMLHAFSIVFTKPYLTDLNLAGIFFALAFLSRHVIDRVAYSEAYTCLQYGVNQARIVERRSGRLGAPTPVSETTLVADPFDRAKVRHIMYELAGISRNTWSASSMFTTVALLLVVLVLSCFIYLTVQSLTSRPPFYSDATLEEMNHLERLTSYWPLDPPIIIPVGFTPKSSFFSAVYEQVGQTLLGGKNDADSLKVMQNHLLQKTVVDEYGRQRNQAFAVPVEVQEESEEGDAALLSAAARRVERQHSSAASKLTNAFSKLDGETLELKRLKRLSPKRVILVILDGLRFDHLTKNADMQTFVQSLVDGGDAVVLKMRAQLPSMSVPNWTTLISGAPPEITGVLGNLLIPELRIDHIFRRASLYDDYIDIDSYDVSDPTDFLNRVESPPFPRGLTASPWFGQIIESTVSALYGFGLVPTNYVAPWEKVLKYATDETSADPADRVRAGIALSATARDDNPYRFFLAHFSDIDQQGHCCGVTTEYNPKNSYFEAVSNKTKILTALIDAVQRHAMSDDTVVVITADHGHVDAGGHGGYTNELLDVPLIFYAPNSNLGSSTPSWKFKAYPNPDSHTDLEARFRRQWPKLTNPFNPLQTDYVPNTAVAPTITALLGIPAPRQSLGWIVNEALPLVESTGNADEILYDLYVQKRELFRVFLGMSGATYQASELKLDIMQADYNSAKDPETSMRAIEQLVELYQDTRARLYNRLYRRNATLCIFVAVAIAIALVCMLHFGSPVYLRGLYSSFFRSNRVGPIALQASSTPLAADKDITNSLDYRLKRQLPWEILLACISKRFDPANDEFDESRVLVEGETWETLGQQFRILQRLNWWAGWFGIICVVLGMGLSLGIFLAVYAALGYPTFEFTTLHTTGKVLARYICLGLLMPILIQFLIVRIFLAFTKTEKITPEELSASKGVTPEKPKLSFFSAVFSFSYDIAPEYLAFVNLFYRYMLFWQCIVLLILTVVQADYEFTIPYIYPTYFISPITWTNRFRTLTLQLIVLPQTFLTISRVLAVPPSDPLSDRLDNWYRIHLFKERALLASMQPTEAVRHAAREIQQFIVILSGGALAAASSVVPGNLPGSPSASMSSRVSGHGASLLSSKQLTALYVPSPIASKRASSPNIGSMVELSALHGKSSFSSQRPEPGSPERGGFASRRQSASSRSSQPIALSEEAEVSRAIIESPSREDVQLVQSSSQVYTASSSSVHIHIPKQDSEEE